MDFKLCLCACIFIVWTMLMWPNSADSSSDFLPPETEAEILKFGEVANLGPDLTKDELLALRELKAIVDVADDLLPRDESYDVWFLLRFLSAKNFNVDEAFQALAEHMDWKQDRDINNILEQEWSDMEGRYPYGMRLLQSKTLRDGVALYMPLGIWNTQNFDSTEDFQRFVRYSAYKMLEDVSRHARVVAAVLDAAGQDSSKFHIIVDMKGTGSGYQGNLDGLLEFIGNLCQYYKEAIDHFIFINVPDFPTFTCSWSPEGNFNLNCPNKFSQTGENILE